MATLNPIAVKLEPKLFDVFQHCETWCTAGCCEWHAFDLSEHWLRRWCEFREPVEIARALEATHALLDELDGEDPAREVDFDRFFVPTVESLTGQLRVIAGVLGEHLAADPET